MAQDRTYTADEIATASRELREAAGAGEEKFSRDQAIAMLGDNIRMLRERGFTFDQIADLCSGFDINVTAAELALHSHQEPIIS